MYRALSFFERGFDHGLMKTSLENFEKYMPNDKDTRTKRVLKFGMRDLFEWDRDAGQETIDGFKKLLDAKTLAFYPIHLARREVDSYQRRKTARQGTAG